MNPHFPAPPKLYQRRIPTKYSSSGNQFDTPPFNKSWSSTQGTYIHRAPQCMSTRRNWDSTNPSPAGECPPPRAKWWGGEDTRLRLWGLGSPNSDDSLTTPNTVRGTGLR
jgi:hypothetical protein